MGQGVRGQKVEEQMNGSKVKCENQSYLSNGRGCTK